MKHAPPPVSALAASLGWVFTVGCGPNILDRELETVVERLDLAPLEATAPPAPQLVRLGEALFFDRELSGNRDVACATCHHPDLHTGDGLSLPVGTGGSGTGLARLPGEGRSRVPRNAPDLFNRGSRAWSTMFWDGRVEMTPHRRLLTPAGARLPEGLDGVLAAQAMFPVTAREEMRGRVGDVDVRGAPNELAALDDDDLPGIWEGLARRLRAIEGYRELLMRAYPGVPLDSLGFQHAANAIAAYEAAAFSFADTPWDAYLRGHRSALSGGAKRGALLFFGKGRCWVCHAGPLFTDQRYHNVGAPQLGPGKGEQAPADWGRALITGTVADRCAFRTPSLRNVALTGPWMHDGAYTTLEGAVRHMADPPGALRAYRASQMAPELRAAVMSGSEAEAILQTLDPAVAEGRDLSPLEIADLVTFLEALTDPAAATLSHMVPTSVPSGLPVDGMGDGSASR